MRIELKYSVKLIREQAAFEYFYLNNDDYIFISIYIVYTLPNRFILQTAYDKLRPVLPCLLVCLSNILC